MKILLVSSFLPYPLFSGGHIRLYNILKLLSKNHEIYLVCEKRNYQTWQDLENIKKFCKKVIAVDRKSQWSLINIVKTGFSRMPFLLIGHSNDEMKKNISLLLQNNKFDLIHVETFYVMQNLPKTQIPIVLAEHNVEYLVYKRFADKAFLPLRLLLYLDVLKLKYWEEKYWKKATKLVAVSKVDRKIMSKKRKDVEVVPNGVDIDKFKVQSSKFKVNKKEKTILFIGDFKWIENVDSVRWILKDIWPKISGKWKMENGKLKLWIVGRNIPDSIKKLTKDKNVIFDENAGWDTSKIYQKADVLLAPIRVGGGTSFKILEAMASGVPVVTTPLGNAISAKENEKILIADNASEFYEKIINLLNNQELYKNIAIKARKFIEEKYDWEKIVGKLEEVYTSAYA